MGNFRLIRQIEGLSLLDKADKRRL